MTDQYNSLSDRINAVEEQTATLQIKLREEVSLHKITAEALKQARARLGQMEQKVENHLSSIALQHISRIYPKSRSVVFMGIGFLGDNIKYAFLEFCAYARKQDITCHFVTEDERQYEQLASFGLPCIMPFSKNSTGDDFQILVSARVAVVAGYFHAHTPREAVSHALLHGAKLIQLWHGIPLKEIGLHSFTSAEVMAGCGPFDVFVATNRASRTDWTQRFAFSEFAPVGYPRNDVFFRDPHPEDLINADREMMTRMNAAHAEGRPVVFYVPTFRNSGIEWLQKADLRRMNEHCRKSGYAFFVNLHPAEHYAYPDLHKQFPDIHFIAPQTDIYPLVKYADVLVTDYSSLAFDFLLLDRPLVFYRPDHDDYISKSRPLIPGRDHYTCGHLASSAGEFPDAVDAAVTAVKKPQSDLYREARRALREELFDFRDGDAAKRVCSLIAKHLDEVA